ncbi:MAG: hypothetical protein P1V51_25020 [Deltaproteobacteria bacterium]|nr:hypothetical protein [Deltaproteobacteria bacterium]
MRKTLAPWPLLLPLLALPACKPDPVHLEIDESCEFLWPVQCAMPYPNDFFTVEDASSPTGRRLALPSEAFPTNVLDEPLDLSPWNRMDGFSTGPTILVAFERPLDPAKLGWHDDYSPSTLPGSATILLDEEGNLVPHFAEHDGLPGYEEPIAFYLRPASKLKEGHRYIVALKTGLTYADGAALSPSEPFRLLRDELESDAPALEARREHFEGIFAALEAAGVAREELLLAWDFTTASGEAVRGDLIHMRDDAMARVGAGGLGCTVTSTTEPGNEIFRQVEGTFTLPSYMSNPDTLSDLVRGADGKPAFQELVEARFVANIPRSLADPAAAPGRLITYGHGQLGAPEEVIWSGGRVLADQLGAVLVSTDFLGMSELDYAAVTRALAQVSFFGSMTDRLHQGLVAEWVLTRTMMGACASEPAFQVNGHLAYDPDERYYLGISQGAIFGWTYLALAPDVERGVLNVGGANYATIVDRSLNFVEFEDRMDNWYERRVDRRLLIVLMEQLWEKTEGWGYLGQIATPLPGMTPRKVLFTTGKNDVAVPNLSADIAARSAGLPLLEPPLEEPWGFERVSPPHDGSAYVTYDLGDPAVPAGSAPPEVDGGVHGDLRKQATHMAQLDAFLRPDGVVINPCSGPCDPD